VHQDCGASLAMPRTFHARNFSLDIGACGNDHAIVHNEREGRLGIYRIAFTSIFRGDRLFQRKGNLVPRGIGNQIGSDIGAGAGGTDETDGGAAS